MADEINEVESSRRKNIVIGVLVVVVIALGVLLFFNMTKEDGVTGKAIIEKGKFESGERILNVVTLDWKPFVYEEGGENKGIAVDIMDEALKNLGVDYDLTLVPWSRALKLGEMGEADAILAATHKDDREEWASFTEEQLRYGREDVSPEAYLLKLDYVLFLKKSNENRLNFESIDQLVLDQYTVGVSQDFSYTPKINAANFSRVVHFSEAESFRALMDDEMDFFLASKEVGLEVLDDTGLKGSITYIDNPVDASYIFLLFSKNSKYPNLNQLIEDVDKEFVKIYASGKYDDIYDKYV